MTAYKWSKTAASNGNIDSTINAREGMAPSQINDSLRAIMAALAKWRDDLAGNLVTGGTSTAYTITSNQVFTSLTDGISVTARMSATNGYAPTLNVDSLGAKAIASLYGNAIKPGRLLSGGIYTFTYDSTDDKWIVQNCPGADVLVGEIKFYTGTTSPTGWLKANGQTIGNASSGASGRANADTADLFAHLWDSFGDSICAVSSGRGANAAADFAANKTIALPDLRGRTLFGLDDMGATAAGRLGTIITDDTTNGASGGSETVTLSASNIPSHTHTFSGNTSTDGAHTHTYTAPVGGAFAAGNSEAGLQTTSTSNTGSSGSHSHTVSGTTDATGSGAAHSNMPPAWLGTWIIRL